MRVPIVNSVEERWEVTNEAVSASIWSLPRVVNEARVWDAASSTNNYRREVEDYVNGETNAALPTGTTYTPQLARALKADVTGYQYDTCLIRRFRKMDFATANAATNRFQLDAGLKLYTTAELSLPGVIAFSVPTVPAEYVFDATDDFMWSWRKRSQTVNIVGIWVEQQVELSFAPWSLLIYTPANAELEW